MLQIADITNGSIQLDESGNPYWEGEGVFDKLLSAINSNIQVQYDNERLTAVEFASLYTKGIEVALRVANDYSLQKELQNKQLELLDKDLLQKDAQLALLQKQLVELNSSIAIKEDMAEADLLLKSKDTAIKENELLESSFNITHLLPKQKEKMEEEIDLLQTKDTALQAEQTRAETMLVKQVAKLAEEVVTEQEKNRSMAYETDSILPKQQLEIMAKTRSIDADTAITDEKRLTEEWSRTHLLPLEENKANSMNTNLTKEGSLLDEKILIEQENRLHKLPAEIKQVNVKSNLYKRQIKGFDDDKNQRMVDKVLETWTIAFSATPTPNMTPNVLNTSLAGEALLHDTFENVFRKAKAYMGTYEVNTPYNDVPSSTT